MSEVLLEAEGVCRRFGGERGLLGGRRPLIHAVEDVHLQLRRGAAVGLVGESGSGKSTLARVLSGLLPPTAGRLLLEGRPVQLRGGARRDFHRRVQLVFQHPRASLNPRRTVAQALDVPLAELAGLDAGARKGRTGELLAQVGLSEAFASRLPHALSGGQAQRVAIARALAAGPQLLILDEAVSALDVSVQAQVVELLRGLHRQLGVGLLFISHDLAVTEALCEQVAVMYLGRVVEQGPRARVLSAPAHPYTQALLAAVPGASRAQARVPLTGEPPSPAAPPPGCAFASRCPQALPACRTGAAPPLAPVAPGHEVACPVSRSAGPGSPGPA